MGKRNRSKARPKIREDEVGPAQGPLWVGTISPFCAAARTKAPWRCLSLQAARRQVHEEVIRVGWVRQLREHLQTLCGKGTASAKYPSVAFERWLFSAKTHETTCQDPLLPARSSQRDSMLIGDLLRVGFAAERANAICDSLQALCQSLLTSGELPRASGLSVKSKKCSGVFELSVPGHTLRVSSVVVDKLRQLYRGTAAEGGGGGELGPVFACAMMAMLLRYHALGGPGFQAGLPAPGFLELQRSLGVEMELFASPLNCFHGAFCSAFPDVDTAFGSCGSFFSFCPSEGSFEANPPFSPPLIDRMLTHLELLLEGKSQSATATTTPTTNHTPASSSSEPQQIVTGPKASALEEQGADLAQTTKNKRKKKHKSGTSEALTACTSEGALSFAVVVPAWTDGPAWARLSHSRFLTATLTIAKEEHMWRQASAEATIARRVPVSTTIFFLQNRLGALKWPANAETLATIKAAMIGDGQRT